MKSLTKDQWPEWVKVSLGDRKNAAVKESNGHFYLYECKSFWDKKLKRPRTKTRYIGRLKEIGGRIREHGHVALLMHLLKKHKVLDSLKENFPESWKELLLFSLDRVVCQSPLKRMGSWAEKTTLEGITGAPLGKKLSQVLARVGTNVVSQNGFMQDMMKDGELLLYDGSVIYSDSEYNKLLEIGHDKENSFQPKANIGLLFSKSRNVPVHFRLFFGSVHEIKTVDRIAHEMRDRSMVFIADKGFYKNGLFADLEELGIGFIIPLPRDDKRIDYHRQFSGVFEYHKRVIRCTQHKAREYWLYHYEDQYLKYAETSDYYRLKLSGKKVMFHEDWAGKISLLSNRKLTLKEAYLLWKSRDRIEKAFDILQNKLEIDKPYVSGEDVFRGYLFASFISLITYYLVLNLLKKYKMNSSVSVEDVLFEFSKIMIEDKGYPTFAEIPLKVKKLAEKLKVQDILVKFWES
jgi:transposase